MVCLGSRHLVGQALHAPGGTAGVVLVVGLHHHVVAGHVRGGDVVDDLLFVRGGSGTDALRDAGCQGGVLLGKDRVVRIARSATGGDARLLAEVVGPGIAVGQAQVIVHVGEVAAALQRGNHLVGLVGLRDELAHLVLGTAGEAKAALEEVLGATAVGKVGVVILREDRAHGLSALEAVHDIDGVEVAINVGPAELVTLGVVHAQVGGTDLIRHGIHVGIRDLVVGEVQKVAHVAGPAAQVRIGLRLGGVGLCHMVGNVQGAKDVTKVHVLAARRRHDLDVAQGHNAGAVGRVLLAHIGDKGGLLLARENLPVAVVVALHTGAHKVEDQLGGILAGVAGCIVLGVAVQRLEEGEECGIVGNARDGLGIRVGLRFRRLLLRGWLFRGHSCLCGGLCLGGLVRRPDIYTGIVGGRRILPRIVPCAFLRLFVSRGRCRQLGLCARLLHAGNLRNRRRGYAGAHHCYREEDGDNLPCSMLAHVHPPSPQDCQ